MLQGIEDIGEKGFLAGKSFSVMLEYLSGHHLKNWNPSRYFSNNSNILYSTRVHFSTKCFTFFRLFQIILEIGGRSSLWPRPGFREPENSTKLIAPGQADIRRY
jgi:hypothetical protein